MDKRILAGLGGEEKLAQLFKAIESNPVIVVVCDALGSIRKVNRKFTEVSGYAAEEVTGTSLHDLAEQDPEETRKMMVILASGTEWVGSLRSCKKNGETYLEEASIFPIQNVFGGITHYVKVAEDVTVRRMTEESVRFLAFYDDITALPNRRLFHDRLRQGLARNERSGEILAIIALDLDIFKKINNSYGHRTGDQVLKFVAERANRRLRACDTLAYFAGGTFMILLPKISRGENAAKVAQNLLASIAEPIHIQNETLYVTASAGIALFPHDGADAATLLKNADLALHRAKEQGGNRYQIFTAAMNDLAVRRMNLENELRQAIDSGAFTLHFQPQFASRSGILTGSEALVRMNSIGGKLVSPDDFIALAEETGLIMRLSNWVMMAACRQTLAFHRAGLSELRVSVNLSPRDFLQQDLPAFVAGCLAETGLPARFLELEITEGSIMVDFERTTTILHEIKATGVSIAIDDFGTGYSSLSILKKIPADILKIDRAFVRGLSLQGADGAIARAVITLAHDLGMQVVAEGVETQVQADILTELGCDVLQGYLFGRPMPADEFLAFAGKVPQRLKLVGNH